MSGHVATLPDAELVAVRWLRAHAELAAVVGSRIYTALPPEPVWPLVRLFRVGGVPEIAGWLDLARLQVDIWGTSKKQARDTAALAARALLELAGSAPIEGAVVTSVEPDLGLQWAPDPDTGQPRYLFGVAVTLHPIP